MEKRNNKKGVGGYYDKKHRAVGGRSDCGGE